MLGIWFWFVGGGLSCGVALWLCLVVVWWLFNVAVSLVGLSALWIDCGDLLCWLNVAS